MRRIVPIETQEHMARAIHQYVLEEEEREKNDPSLQSVLRTSMHLWMKVTLAPAIEEAFSRSNVVQFPRDGAA